MIKNYENSSVRRQDRLLEEERAQELLHNGEYGILSFGGCGNTGRSGTSAEVNGSDYSGGYCVPISYAWDGGEFIYFHCAPEGEKLRRLAVNNRVCFCVVGGTEVLPSKFSTFYESILVFGELEVTEGEDERMKGVVLLLDKYSPDDKRTGLKYAEKSLPRTVILRLKIGRVSGKCKK